jgi:hypothetical protein
VPLRECRRDVVEGVVLYLKVDGCWPLISNAASAGQTATGTWSGSPFSVACDLVLDRQ